MALCDRIDYYWGNRFRTSVENGFVASNTERFEECWSCPAAIGDGVFRWIEIRPGFTILVTDCKFKNEIFISSHNVPALFMFAFYLSGHSTATMPLYNEPVYLSGGQQGLHYFPDPNGVNHAESQPAMRHVCILIKPEQLCFYFEDDMPFLPKAVREIAERNRNDPFIHVEGFTAAMHVALHQMLNCRHRGPVRKLYLESRALELVAYQLEQILVEQPSTTRSLIIRADERKRTDFAKDLLLKDLENPPGLEELARAAGMSHPKLNRCFREMYGMTVFQCLRNERLNRAREMLERQGLTVTETAYAVGYYSISHFSKAYRKHFGILPGVYSRPASRRPQKKHTPGASTAPPS